MPYQPKTPDLAIHSLQGHFRFWKWMKIGREQMVAMLCYVAARGVSLENPKVLDSQIGDVLKVSRMWAELCRDEMVVGLSGNEAPYIRAQWVSQIPAGYKAQILFIPESYLEPKKLKKFSRMCLLVT